MRRRKARRNKMWIAVASCILLSIAVCGAVAYLTAKTEPLKNEFVPVEVTCKIEETFENNIKKDVCVRNTGDVDAFVRAMVVANWVSNQADGKVCAQTPVEGADYSVEWGTEGWKKGADGFWYYTEAVSSQGVTKDLIETSAMLQEAPEGYHLEIRILASAIQVAPEYVVEQEWGVAVDNGKLTVNN